MAMMGLGWRWHHAEVYGNRAFADVALFSNRESGNRLGDARKMVRAASAQGDPGLVSLFDAQ